MFRKLSEIIFRVRAVLSKPFTFPIKLYQKYISPHTPAKCKYYPTCSSYAVTAIERYGVIVGGALAIWRLLRCNPWSKGGIDYVPDNLFKKRKKGDR